MHQGAGLRLRHMHTTLLTTFLIPQLRNWLEEKLPTFERAPLPGPAGDATEARGLNLAQLPFEWKADHPGQESVPRLNRLVATRRRLLL